MDDAFLDLESCRLDECKEGQGEHALQDPEDQNVGCALSNIKVIDGQKKDTHWFEEIVLLCQAGTTYCISLNTNTNWPRSFCFCWFEPLLRSSLPDFVQVLWQQTVTRGAFHMKTYMSEALFTLTKIFLKTNKCYVICCEHAKRIFGIKLFQILYTIY